jgi:hypothetical protein
MTTLEERRFINGVVGRSELEDGGFTKFAIARCPDTPRIDFIAGGNSFIAITPLNLNTIRELCDDVEAKAKRMDWDIDPAIENLTSY